jgi:hypothetical protein
LKKPIILLGCIVVLLALAAALTARSSASSSKPDRPIDAKTAAKATSNSGARPANSDRIATRSSQIDDAAAGMSPFMRRQFAPGGMFEGHNPSTEIIEKRGMKAKHFEGSGGTAVAVLTTKPVHYQDAAGSWKDIDTRIVRSAAGDHRFENTTNNVKSLFPAAGLSGKGVSVGSDASAIKIGFNPSLIWTDEDGVSTVVESSTADSAPKVSNDTITYGRVLPSADNQFIVQTEGLKNNLLLDKIPAAVKGKAGTLGYSEEIEIPAGWSLSSGGKQITGRARVLGPLYVVDTIGRAVYSFPKPTVYDAASAIAGDATAPSAGPFFEVAAAGKRMQVITAVPLSWLLDGHRQFPVTLDPTVQFTNLASVGDWYNCPSCACPGCNPPISAPPLYEPSAEQDCMPSNSYNRDQQSDTGWFSFDVSSLANACITQTEFNSLRIQVFTNPPTCESSIDIDLYSVLVQPGPTTAFGNALIAPPSVGALHYGATACSISLLDISAANADVESAAQQGILYTIGLATSESPGALSAFIGPILQVTYTDFAITPSTLSNATVGVPYSVTLSTGSGSPTYSATGLPSSIKLSGATLSGTPTSPGSFPVTVTATDPSTGCTSTIDYTLTVSCSTTINPSTLAGGTAGTPYSVSFSGASGSPHWTATGLPPGLSMGLTTGILSGTPTQSGTFTVSVDADDTGIGCDVKGSYSLTIVCPTITVNVPTIPAGIDGVAYTPVTITETGGIGATTFTETGTLPTGMTLSSGGVLSGTPTKTGTFNFTVTATDADGCTGTHSATITINCPTITVNVPTIPAGIDGVAYTPVTFTETGGIGATTFSETGTLPTGMTLSTAGVLSGTPTKTGTFNFSVTVTDVDGCTGTHSASITVNCPTITVTVPAIPAATGGVAYTAVTFTQTGGIGSTTFGETGSLPTGMTLSSGGLLSGTPTKTGTFSFTVTATDSDGCTGTNTASITVNCPAISVGVPAMSAGTAGVAYSAVTFTQTSGVGATTFTETGALPTGMSLSTGGVLSGTPTQTGSFPISVTATDSNLCTGTAAATVIINCPAIPVSPATIPSGTAGVPYTASFSETGGVGTVVFTESGTLPAGVTLSGAVLSGTPTQTGSFPISVTATDKNGCTGSASYTLVINCPTLNVSPAGVPQGTAGVVYSSTTFTQTGGVGTITFSESGTLPTGITLSTGGLLSGTPTQTGSFPITVTATDKNACAGSAGYTLVINCPVVTVNPTTVPSGTAGVAYSSTTFTQTGGVGAITFTESGTLPAGMSFSGGVLSGTPTQIGSFRLTVTATDKNSCTGSRGYTLVINCPAITVDPAAIAPGTAGVAYSNTTFTQTGGVGAITYSELGALPTGVTFTSSGVLSGTPLQTGTFPITVTATDKNGCTGSRAYTLIINCPTIIVGPSSVPAAVQFVPYTPTQFTQTGGVGSITYSTASGLPTGMTLTSGGLLSGTPTQGGTFSITVTATDANGCTGGETVGVPVTLLNTCLIDDHNGNFVQFNVTTGDYLFTYCGAPGFTMSGKATVANKSGLWVLTDSKSDRNVMISYSPNQLTGTAMITTKPASGVSQSYKISDTNPYPVCVCERG